MITYAANIEPLFGDADLCEKIVLAKQAGRISRRPSISSRRASMRWSSGTGTDGT